MYVARKSLSKTSSRQCNPRLFTLLTNAQTKTLGKRLLNTENLCFLHKASVSQLSHIATYHPITDIDAGLAKAQKINSHSGHPKVSDHNDISREVILRATSHYRVLISTCEVFLDSATEIRMVKEAWTSVNMDSCLPPITISLDISKIISQWWFSVSTLAK
jgi:hypothetical protein